MVYLTYPISCLLNLSTTVEIYMVYLTGTIKIISDKSTTVEIYMVYLTIIVKKFWIESTTVEIYMVYLTLLLFVYLYIIYNSRNLYGLFDKGNLSPYINDLQQ